MTTSLQPRWLTVTDVCDELGISRDTFDKWRARGCAPRAKRLPNGQLRIASVWLDDFMTALPEEVSA